MAKIIRDLTGRPISTREQKQPVFVQLVSVQLHPSGRFP